MQIVVPVPYKTTMSDGLIRLNNKWKSKNTGLLERKVNIFNARKYF